MTTRRLLALNVGSSTLKGASYLLNAEVPGAQPRVVERSRVEISVGPDAQERLATLLETLSETAAGPEVVVHRIVHGGDLHESRELDEAVLAKLDALVPFAPLHQPLALAFARAARLRWLQARQGVAFDTDFHASLAPWSRRLPIPEAWDALGIRRYGFHGLAFASALRIVASHDAEFCDPVVTMGVCGVEWFVHPWELGPRKAKEMLFTADAWSAEEAHRLGMVNHVVPRGELSSFVLKLAERIAAKPSFALKLTKKAINGAQDAQGRELAMQNAFHLHQLAHTHWLKLYDFLLDPTGLPEATRRALGIKTDEGA